MPKDFWSNFQLFLRENRLPSLIVQILNKTGYDTPFSIELLDQEKIKGIEQIINKRFDSISSIFKDTEYENSDTKVDTFEFLPGHITLLLGIGVYVKKYLGQSFENKKSKRFGKLSTIPEDLETETELYSEEEREQLKKSLVKKVLNFSKKFNLSVENISHNSIKGNLEVILKKNGVIVYKCTFCCSIDSCEVSIPCIFNKYWLISNLERHIKTHIVDTRKPDAKTVHDLNELIKSTQQIQNEEQSNQHKNRDTEENEEENHT